MIKMVETFYVKILNLQENLKHNQATVHHFVLHNNTHITSFKIMFEC